MMGHHLEENEIALYRFIAEAFDRNDYFTSAPIEIARLVKCDKSLKGDFEGRYHKVPVDEAMRWLVRLIAENA